MQCYRVVISEKADRRLNDYIEYIIYDLENPLAAKLTLEGIKRKINMLSIYPTIYGKVKDKELFDEGIRKIRYKKYKIYYMLSEEEKIVYIVDILHELMNEKNQLKNLE